MKMWIIILFDLDTNRFNVEAFQKLIYQSVKGWYLIRGNLNKIWIFDVINGLESRLDYMHMLFKIMTILDIFDSKRYCD